MPRPFLRLFVTLVLLLLGTVPAYAQGGTSAALSALVVDAAGGVIPAATVAVKNTGTGTVGAGTGTSLLPTYLAYFSAGAAASKCGSTC